MHFINVLIFVSYTVGHFCKIDVAFTAQCSGGALLKIPSSLSFSALKSTINYLVKHSAQCTR